LYPKGKVSPTQELQLVVERKGVSTLAIEGTFDDCQRLVKQAFQDEALASLHLSSANSINIGRLLPQMLYYFWAVVHGRFEAPVFCVPSGNLGNLTAGMIAHLGGLPVHRFIAAHNRNDFFPNFLAGADAVFKPSVHTPSSAMDVGAPSNFERLHSLLPDDTLRQKVWGSRVTDEETLSRLRHVYDRTGYLADPHTAVGVECVLRYQFEAGRDRPCIVLATAHPAKFPEVIKRAIGNEPATPKTLVELALKPKSATPMSAAYDVFRAYLQSRL
jgi:threonine synthase